MCSDILALLCMDCLLLFSIWFVGYCFILCLCPKSNRIRNAPIQPVLLLVFVLYICTVCIDFPLVFQERKKKNNNKHNAYSIQMRNHPFWPKLIVERMNLFLTIVISTAESIFGRENEMRKTINNWMHQRIVHQFLKCSNKILANLPIVLFLCIWIAVPLLFLMCYCCFNFSVHFTFYFSKFQQSSSSIDL